MPWSDNSLLLCIFPHYLKLSSILSQNDTSSHKLLLSSNSWDKDPVKFTPVRENSGRNGGQAQTACSVYIVKSFQLQPMATWCFVVVQKTKSKKNQTQNQASTFGYFGSL